MPSISKLLFPGGLIWNADNNQGCSCTRATTPGLIKTKCRINMKDFFPRFFSAGCWHFYFACGAQLSSPRLASPRLASRRRGAELPGGSAHCEPRSQTCLLREQRRFRHERRRESGASCPSRRPHGSPPTRWVSVPRTDPRMEPSDGELLLWRRFIKNPARADGGSRAGLAAQIAAQFAPNALNAI